MSSYLTREQIEQILRPINPVRVSNRDGMAYVEAYEVRAHMARIFGVARWSSEVIDQQLICEEAVQTRQGKPAWYVAYRTIVKVTVCAPDGTQLAVYSEGHAGDSTHPTRGEAHGNAITNSESYAFKRAACMALLDQGGLSLYAKGSTTALVRRTLVMPGGELEVAGQDVSHDTGPVVPEDPAPQDHHASAETPPASVVPPSPGTSPSATPDVVEQFRGRVLAATRPQELAHLGAEIAKAKLLREVTVSETGTPITLGALLNAVTNRVTARAS